MSALRFLSKFLRFNSIIVNNTPNIDLTTKIQTLNYTAWYFTFLQNDLQALTEKVEQLEKELNDTRFKLQSQFPTHSPHSNGSHSEPQK